MSHLDETDRKNAAYSSAGVDEALWRTWQQKNRAADAKATARRLVAVKWLCIGLLFSFAGFERYATRFQLEWKSVLCAGAVIVGCQAMFTRRYVAAGIFALVFLLYNPMVPILHPSGSLHFLIVFASILPFAASLVWLNSKARLDGAWLYPNRGWGRVRAVKVGQ